MAQPNPSRPDVPGPSTSVDRDDVVDRPDAKPEIADFVLGYENPVSWYRTHRVPREKLINDVLFDNTDMRDIMLDQYSGADKPEHVKWKLIGYNIVICHEYIVKETFDEGLKTIGFIEEILLSIGDNDSFLKSIRIALNHITFSMKGHLMKLCSLDTKCLNRFILADNMNNVNKAGLCGVQSFFFYEYGLPCAHIAKDSALKAISLNVTEPEWYFLLARVLTHWQRVCGNYSEYSEQETEASEMAVKLGNKDHHKLHLVHIYIKISKNSRTSPSSKNHYADKAFQILKEVINNNNEILQLKNCLLSLSKMSIDKNNISKCHKDIPEMLEKLIDQLGSSNNGYVHGAIGNYYLFNKKDYIKANYHLLKAFNVKSFGSSIDYIFTLYKMDPETAKVEQMLVDMVKKFPHPVHREKILSQIVSYLILTKRDIIQALKYIPSLLNIKDLTSIYSLQAHIAKFTQQHSPRINLLDLLSETLDTASNDPALSSNVKKKIAEVQGILETFKRFVKNLMKEREQVFGKGSRKDYRNNNNSNNDDKPPFGGRRNEQWTRNNQKDTSNVKNDRKKEDNWRTLKPDTDPKSNVFSRGYNKQISTGGSELKLQLTAPN